MSQNLPLSVQAHVISAYRNPQDPLNQQIIESYQASTTPSQDNETSMVTPAAFNPIMGLKIKPQDVTDADRLSPPAASFAHSIMGKR